MTLTLTTETAVNLERLVDGYRYVLMVTGATSAVNLQFKNREGGAWFTLPGFVATPTAGGVVTADFIAPTAEMRVTLAAGQATEWVLSWVKVTMAET